MRRFFVRLKFCCWSTYPHKAVGGNVGTLVTGSAGQAATPATSEGGVLISAVGGGASIFTAADSSIATAATDAGGPVASTVASGGAGATSAINGDVSFSSPPTPLLVDAVTVVLSSLFSTVLI